MALYHVGSASVSDHVACWYRVPGACRIMSDRVAIVFAVVMRMAGLVLLATIALGDSLNI